MKTLKAGKYYVGDCCYILGRRQGDYWDFFIEQFCNDEENISIDRFDIVAYSTAYGDGIYSSNIDFDFPVDAGLIGIIPEELWKKDEKPFGCILVDFTKDFNCWNDNYVLHFGHISIDTDPEY